MGDSETGIPQNGNSYGGNDDKPWEWNPGALLSNNPKSEIDDLYWVLEIEVLSEWSMISISIDND